MEIIDRIAKIPLFEGLPEAQLKDLASIAIQKSFTRGQTIFSEGETGSGFYVTISGIVKIFKTSPDGKEQILHIFGPNEPFGELPFLRAGISRPTLWRSKTAAASFSRGLLL